MDNALYTKELFSIYKTLPDEKKEAFSSQFALQAKNPTTVFGCSAYLGMWGVDRFVLGDVGLGVVKLLTLGGLGVWYVIDLFLVSSRARAKNLDLARQVAAKA
jgi:TM2 domain-containing membrane protein YozV